MFDYFKKLFLLDKSPSSVYTTINERGWRGRWVFQYQEEKYNTALEIIIKECIYLKHVNIEEFVEVFKHQNIIAGIRSFYFPECCKEDIISRLKRYGIITCNYGRVELNVIGDTTKQYSLSPFAYNWLTLQENKKIINKNPERIQFFILLIAIITLFSSLMTLYLTYK